MDVILTGLIVVIILFHIYAFILEAFLWQTPRAFQAFGTNQQTAKSSQKLAINQGVYNLFISAGLIVGLFASQPVGIVFMIFFLLCVVAAAVTAGFTVSKRIMLVQGTPAVLALIFLLIA